MKRDFILYSMAIIFLMLGCSKDDSKVDNQLILKAGSAGTATINLAGTRQVIRGFGASSAWHGALTDADCDKLFTTLGLSILRVRIDPDGSWADEISNAKKAVARGAIVFASPWSPPASMKSNGSAIGGYLLENHYADYANWLNNFVSTMSSNGVSLYAISVQNEPNINVSYESCSWTSAQMFNFMVNNAGAINTKVMMPETFNYLTSYADPILNNPTGLANTDICAHHWYGANRFQLWTNAYNKGKDIWMTEHYSDDQSISGAVSTAVEIYKMLTVNYENAYIWWYAKNPGCNLITDAGINPRGYVMGQFAKFVRPGYYRVDVTGSSNITAFTGNDKVVIIAINAGRTAVNQKFIFQGGSVTSVTPIVTSSVSNMQTGSPIIVSGGSFSSALPATSVTTFVSN